MVRTHHTNRCFQEMTNVSKLGLVVGTVLASFPCQAQTATNMTVLKGLAPVTVLAKTPAGRAALGANFAVTGGIQLGTIRQPTLLPFAEQQQQSLRDAFITDGNLAELADGLGSTLGAAYQARAHYLDREHFTNVSPAIADLIAYTNGITGGDSNAGKYFFANATTDGKTAVSDAAAAILRDNGGATDPFGKAYARPGGSPGADAFGDSRPFQTEPTVLSDRRAGLFLRSRQQRRLQSGPDLEPHGQPLLPERPHHLRLHGFDPHGRPGAGPLPADDRARGRVRQRPHSHGSPLRDGRARRPDPRHLRPGPPSRQ